MREHLGEEYGGVVTAVTTFISSSRSMRCTSRAWCTSPNSVASTSSSTRARQELRGERTGIRYAIGSRVQVQVSRVDLDGRKIGFRLVREGEELTARTPKDKGGGGNAGVPAKASDKRQSRRAAAKSAERDGRADRTSSSPIQALKSAVKSAAGKLRKKRKTPRP